MSRKAIHRLSWAIASAMFHPSLDHACQDHVPPE
eukprot:CAMPEP_0183416452 /NCGR_PEP_ID=MMETSP0370-20130417/23777_1 /TAXON_ID=268820 /ORGANISM="Peridinium aciculiferum, Strain PAER-2" /LENGTH=33 /DNA_ID= /DNA_START= /DNA_END= /DNA_ORIENTATION=